MRVHAMCRAQALAVSARASGESLNQARLSGRLCASDSLTAAVASGRAAMFRRTISSSSSIMLISNSGLALQFIATKRSCDFAGH